MAELYQRYVVLFLGTLVLYEHSLAVSFKNGDFESSDYNGNWDAMSCTLSPSNDAYTGRHSVHVLNRHDNWNGLSQNVNLQGNKVYKVMFYVKLLSNVHNSMYQEVEAVVNCKNSHGKDFYQGFGRSPHVQHGLWYAVGGVNKIPAGSHSCRMYLQTPAPTEYLVDHASIQEVTLDSNWKTAANQRINNLRKADVSIRLAGSHSSSTSVSIELEQQRHEFAFGSAVKVGMITDSSHHTYQQVFYDLFEWAVFENALKWYATEPQKLVQQRHEFAFGSAVNAGMITDSSHHAYQQVFYDLFEWAVFGNALKWYATEPRKGVFHYDKPLNAIKLLREHGIHIRGHNVFWEADKYVQDWVKGLSNSQLMSEIDARVQRVIGRTKGLLEHWDVNNEDINNDYYAKTTHNPNITMEMFKKVHALDNYPKLYLNEYNILSTCDKAVALMDKARRFKQSGVPIGGIGVQGHLQHIDMNEIWERLNVLGEAGLPVLITELGINEKNVNIKAQKLEDLLTMFFSHPSVEGVIFWGFWDGALWEQDAVLFSGPNVTPNAAGLKLQDLLKTQWRTHKFGTIHGSQTWHARAFKGAYKLSVKHNGHVINTEYFSLSGSGQTVELHIDGEQNGHPHVSHIIVG